MPEGANKWIEILDKLLPFLAASPTWLKFWIYIVIFLNFLTIAGLAVSYLVSRETREREGTLEHGFTIESPRLNENIALGDHNTVVLEGRFPRLAGNHDRAAAASIEVEVFTIPARQSIPQTGKQRVSTTGSWRYESAKFSGAGPYEIVVTAHLGNENTFRHLSVDCTQKSEAYKQRIASDRESRGANRLVTARVEAAAIPAAKTELYELQLTFFELLGAGNVEGALQNVNATLDILDPLLVAFPEDLDLQTDRAYTFKNYAQVMLRLNRDAEVERALAESEVMFEGVRDQRPRDAGAWNGIGSVYAIRGWQKESKADYAAALEEYSKALRYIDIALDIMDGRYPAAESDRTQVVQAIEKVQRLQDSGRAGPASGRTPGSP